MTIYLQVPGAAGSMTIEANMSHPGMAPVFATATRQAAGGKYKGQLQLNMPGDWVILVKAKTQGGRAIQQQFPITVSEK